MAELKKSLGVARLTFYGVGTIVGAGIYTVIGAAAGQAGYQLWLSFILAAVAAVLAALSYAELTSSYPNAGAEFIFLRKAFPDKDLPSFLTGWTIFFHSSATVAAVLIAFAGYFSNFFDLPGWTLSYGLLALLFALAILGIKKSSTINIIMVSLSLLGLVLLILFGYSEAGLPEAKMFEIPAFGKALTATGTIFFIYTGFEHMAALGSEAKKPGKTIPLAFLLTMIITTVIYLLIVFVVLQVAKPEELNSVNSPLSLAAGNINPWLPSVLAIAAIFATANAAFSGMLSISRVMYGMASKAELPAFLQKTNSKKAPWAATLIVGIGIGVFLLFGEIKTVAGMSSLGALLVFIAINISLIRLRYKAPEKERPFTVPLSIGKLPVLPLLSILICAALALQFSWTVYAGFGGAILVGVVFDYFFDKHKASEETEEKK
ncbi:MAG: APC family permease [Salinimicrobium sp.]